VLLADIAEADREHGLLAAQVGSDALLRRQEGDRAGRTDRGQRGALERLAQAGQVLGGVTDLEADVLARDVDVAELAVDVEGPGVAGLGRTLGALGDRTQLGELVLLGLDLRVDLAVVDLGGRRRTGTPV
jgi:hypothetical protein